MSEIEHISFFNHLNSSLSHGCSETQTENIKEVKLQEVEKSKADKGGRKAQCGKT